MTIKKSYKKYHCSGKNTKIFEEFTLLQNKIVNLTNDLKDRYYIKEVLYHRYNIVDIIQEYLINLMIQTYPPKYTGRSIISPLFHEYRFVADFTKKAEFFNSFFTKQ